MRGFPLGEWEVGFSIQRELHLEGFFIQMGSLYQDRGLNPEGVSIQSEIFIQPFWYHLVMATKAGGT